MSTTRNNPIDSSEINLRDMYEKFRLNYKWFILGVFLSILVAYAYLHFAPNQYSVNASILIDDKDNGGGMNSELTAFKDLGLLDNGKTSLDTQIDVIKSRTLMIRTIKDLGINVTYFLEKNLRLHEQYKKSAPFRIDFLQKDSLFFSIDTSFIITALSKTKFALSDNERNQALEGTFGKKIHTNIGDIVVTYKNSKKVITGTDLQISIKPLKKTANKYLNKLFISPKSKKSSVLILSIKDNIKQKAIDVLNNLIFQYNNDAIEDKLKIAQNTEEFINNRIKDISKELSNVDIGVESFKTENKLTNIDFEAGLDLTSNSEVEKKIIDLTSQIKLIDYINIYLKENKNALIPGNLGLRDESVSQSTSTYNNLLLERDRILKSSSKMNPTVVNLEAQISNLRVSIEQSLENLRSSLKFSLNEARSQESRLNKKRSAAPKKERELRDIKRKQQIIETLYLYLLQKREENAIALAVTSPNAKIIDKADGSDIPVSPKRKLIYIIAALLGFIITFIILSIRFFLDNNIHSLEDVESVVKAPILGDIPNTGEKQKVVIKGADNSHLSESFRLLRTNLDFMLTGKYNGAKTIFVTSTVGNEGKTFVAINLAVALKLLNKRVLLIGADVRKPKIAKYLDIKVEKGLTNFLTYQDMQIANIIVHDEKTGLDIIHSGEIPPNPSELLNNGRFKEIIDYGKQHYDYVIVDTAPVNIVTDTLLLGHFADMFVYVIRANYLDKRMLKIPQTMYENNRLPNMAILINDTDYKKKGYGYGYSYSYEEKKKKSWWKK